MSLSFRVRRSPISGRGCFATRRIRKCAVVAEYVGERITQEEADKRYTGSTHTMLFDLDDWFIDGGVAGNGIEYANASCEPNAESEERGRHVLIKALRAIEPGDEITYDYGLYTEGPWLKKYASEYRCTCGSKRCRGTLLKSPKAPKAQRDEMKRLARKRAR